jgi:hypothetical protein
MQKKKRNYEGLQEWGVSCRNVFKRLEILPHASQYILSLMLFVVSNKNLFNLNSEKHNTRTRQLNNFYQAVANLSVYQNGVYYMGIRVYNNIPPHIKDIS